MSGGALAAFAVTLLVSAAAVVALMLVTFAISLAVGRNSVVDTAWGLGFALVAVVSLATSAGHGDLGRRLLLTLATVAWGVRLAAHIGWRSRGAGEDPRYAAMLAKAPGSRAAYALRKVFLTQAAVIWLISIPVQAGMFERARLGPLAVAGGLIWLCGLIFEAGGDWQLARFKADPGNRGKIMDSGLWRYTRHPNYFGDSCVWWGLFLISLGSWWGLLAVFSPVAMTFLLTRGSGKPITEAHMMATRPGYARYAARTSGFFPLPPRAAPRGGT
jgi:steroid 5-alpha reductase family enzyme